MYKIKTYRKQFTICLNEIIGFFQEKIKLIQYPKGLLVPTFQTSIVCHKAKTPNNIVMKITAGLLSELMFLESIRVMTANCINMQKSNKTIAGSI